MFSDKVLVCKECGKEFAFSASEQEFYADKVPMNRAGARNAEPPVKPEQGPRRRKAVAAGNAPCHLCRLRQGDFGPFSAQRRQARLLQPVLPREQQE